MQPFASFSPSSPPVTELLLAWGAGDDSALQQLIPVVRAELHRLARHYMRRESSDHTLQATALVNEAYMRLVDMSRVRWQDRVAFFRHVRAADATDSGRSRACTAFVKRGGGAREIPFDEALVVSASAASISSRSTTRCRRWRQSIRARARSSSCASLPDSVSMKPPRRLCVSPATVMRDWRVAKAWLLASFAAMTDMRRRTLARVDGFYDEALTVLPEARAGVSGNGRAAATKRCDGTSRTCSTCDSMPARSSSVRPCRSSLRASRC